MGETLGIAHNVFEKAERERDRKQRLKALEDWQKEKSARMKRASIYGKSTGNRPGTTFTMNTTTTSLGSTSSSGGGKVQTSNKDLRQVQEKVVENDEEKESIESNDSKKESTCMCVIL